MELVTATGVDLFTDICSSANLGDLYFRLMALVVLLRQALALEGERQYE